MADKIKPTKLEVITIPNKVAVFADKKTGVKTAAFPFTFASGVNGVVSVTHLERGSWEPADDIEAIAIKFKPA